MTVPSNEELQRLLDEATPGPWTTVEDRYTDRQGNIIYHPDEIVADAIEDDIPVMWNADGAVDWTSKPGNPRLAALAPVLAAEVIRLREEIKSLREHYRGLEKGYDDASIPFSPGRWFSHNAVQDLTRILEGDQA